MGLFDWAFKAPSSNRELPDIFPISIAKDLFVKSDIFSTYEKILIDVLERTHGLPEKYQPLLWDNCLQSEASHGLVSLLADAMTTQTDLFIVYVPSVNLVRKATTEEQKIIEADYKKSGTSKAGVFVSFKKYRRTEMLTIYSAFEWCVLGSLNKTLNLSKAIQIKTHELRASVSNADSSIAETQAKALAVALGQGKDILIDKLDEITTATPDTSSSEKAIAFLDSKRAFILGLPLAYISGEQTGGIGSTGEADARAVERGLKQYFVSIIQPVLFALFGAQTEFRSEDFRQITTALEVLKVFELVGDENLSRETKLGIITRVFDVDLEEEKKRIEKEKRAAPPALPPPVVPPRVEGAA